MGFGAVVEPEHTVLPFAAADQVEVSVRKQLGGQFGQWSEQRLGRGCTVDALDVGRAGRVCVKLQATRAFGEEGVQCGQVEALACFTALYKVTHELAKAQSSAEESTGFPRGGDLGVRGQEMREFEPMKNIAV